MGIPRRLASKLLKSSLKLRQLLLHSLSELADSRIVLHKLLVFLHITLQFRILPLLDLIPVPQHVAFLLESFDLLIEEFSASVPVVILIEDLLQFIERRILLLTVLVLAVVLDVDEVLVEGLGGFLVRIFVVHFIILLEIGIIKDCTDQF